MQCADQKQNVSPFPSRPVWSGSPQGRVLPPAQSENKTQTTHQNKKDVNSSTEKLTIYMRVAIPF